MAKLHYNYIYIRAALGPLFAARRQHVRRGQRVMTRHLEEDGTS